MNRTRKNYLIDVMLTLLFFVVALTGLFMYLFIPEGVPRGRYQEYLGLSKATWVLIHNRASIMMTALVGAHLFLHKGWIACATRNMFSKRNSETCEIDDQG